MTITLDQAEAAARFAKKLIAAAMKNEDTLAFIELGIWTLEDVREDPHCRYVFRLGVIFSGATDPGSIRYGSEVRGMGEFLGIWPLDFYDPLDPYFRTLWFHPDHPRRIRYETRMTWKKRLPNAQRRLVTKAMQFSMRRFLTELKSHDWKVLDSLQIDPREFWRDVRQGPRRKG